MNGRAASTATRQGRLAVAAFLLGNGISVFGNTLALVALPWFVLQTTGSAGQTGVTGMAGALPVLIAGVVGGVLVDRVGGRRMSVVSDLISGVSVLLIPLLYVTVGIAFWQLLVLVFLGAALDIPGVTARRTLLPDLAERGGMSAEAMNSAFETMQGASFIIGPALAGVLIAWLGAVHLLWITAATFAISAVLIGYFSPAGTHVVETTEIGGMIAEVREGMRFLRTDSLLLTLAIGLTLMNFLFQPFWNVVLPVLVEERYEVASRFGFVLTMFGSGTLAGGMVYGALGPRFRHHRRTVFLAGVLAFTLMLWINLIRAEYAVIAVAALLVGVVTGPINPLLVTVRLERIPKELRGRVFATFSALSGAAAPLGMLCAGWLIEGLGLETGLLVLATTATVFTTGLWLTRPYRLMNVDASSPKAGPASRAPASD